MRRIPWWALASSSAAPVLLIGGFTLAEARQPPTYDSIRDTISALAALGANDRWIMTSALAGLGASHVITAAGLGPVPWRARVVLAAGGVATVLVAAFPQPARGNSAAHTVAAAAAFIFLGCWPALSLDRASGARVLRGWVPVGASVGLLGLVAWFAAELHGGQRGLAERAAASAQALWPLVVVVTAHRAVTRRGSGEGPGSR